MELSHIDFILWSNKQLNFDIIYQVIYFFCRLI